MAKLDAVRKYQLRPDGPIVGAGGGDSLDDTIDHDILGDGIDKQIAFWAGITLTGENELWYDYDTDRVAIGSNSYVYGRLTVSAVGMDIDADDTATSYGIYQIMSKTGGATDVDYYYYGILNSTQINDTGVGHGGLTGFYNTTTLTDGDLGDGGNTRHMYGIYNLATHTAGTIYGNAAALYSELQQDGGTISTDAHGLAVYVDQNAGTISGDACGGYIWADFDGTVTGTSYMLYLFENTGIDYGVYQNGTGLNYFGGWVGIEVDPPTSPLHVEDLTVDTDATYIAIENHHIKTTGATDYDDHIYGISNHIEIDDNGQEHGNLYGFYNYTYLDDGDLGAALHGRAMYGIHNTVRHDAGTVYDDVMGIYTFVNLDGGSGRDLWGQRINVDQESGAGVIGSAYGLDITATYDGGMTQNLYSLYLDTRLSSNGIVGGDAYGIYNLIQLDSSADHHQNLYGIYNWTYLDSGNLGEVAAPKSGWGIYNWVQHDANFVLDDLHGINTIVDLNGGTVSDDVFGHRVYIDQEAGHIISDDAFGIRIAMDLAGAVTGTAYALYWQEVTTIDYGLYQNGTADNYFGGFVGILHDTPDYPLHIEDTAIDTTAEYRGINVVLTKTAGATDHDDPFYGIYNYATLNDSQEYGSVAGLWTKMYLDDANVGDAVNVQYARGIANQIEQDAGTVYGDLMGINHMLDLDAGTAAADASGIQVWFDQGAGHTVSGDAHGLYVNMDCDGTVTGSAYMIYLDEQTNVDYGIYHNGSASHYLGTGNVGIGDTTPNFLLHVVGSDAITNGPAIQVSNTEDGSGGGDADYDARMLIVTAATTAVPTLGQQGDPYITMGIGSGSPPKYYAQMMVDDDDSAKFKLILSNDGGATTPVAMSVTNDGDGKIGFNTASPNLAVVHSYNDTAGRLCLHLEQTDIDHSFIAFTGEADAGQGDYSLVRPADDGTEALRGWIRIYIEDKGNEITDGHYHIPFYELNT